MTREILVVEDDKGLRKQLERALIEAGFTVRCEGRGDKAIDYLKRSRPAAAVVGLTLPGASGFRVAAVARDRSSGEAVPVLALSGTFTGPRNREDALARLGLVDLLPKPVDPHHVAEILGHHLDHRPAPRSAPGSFDLPVEVDEAGPGEGTQPARRRRAPKKQGNARAHRRSEDPGPAPLGGDLELDAKASGSLAELAFGRLLHALHTAGATGVLEVSTGRKRKSIHLDSGEPIHIEGNVVSECLGRVLAREGLISDAECKRSVRILRERDALQGQVLIELGCISETNLEYGLARQLETKLLEPFDWEAGTYRFTPGAQETPARARLPEGVPAVVSEGVRRRMPADRVRRELEGVLDRYPVWGSQPRFREQELGLLPGEEEFFAHLDGTRPVQAVIDDAELEPEVAERVLLTLLCTRKVELMPDREARNTERVVGPGAR